MVEAVTSAFPDVPFENVVYSLTRTRSAQSTSEIILERGTVPAVSILWPTSALHGKVLLCLKHVLSRLAATLALALPSSFQLTVSPHPAS